MNGIYELVGKTITSIAGESGGDELIFNCADGSSYLMYHDQDCCEQVYLEDVCGDLSDLLNSEVLVAREDSNAPEPDAVEYRDFFSESHTWTFYNLATANGWVTLRWLGESNGYYSESVDFIKID